MALLNGQGELFKIISNLPSGLVEIEFEDGTKLIKRKYDALAGKVRNPNRVSYYGVGFEGIGEYRVYSGLKKSKSGDAWVSMLKRCYSPIHLNLNPSYRDCLVNTNWHDFQKFSKWFYTQKASCRDDCVLDKDILFTGNKIYSEETCCLVPATLNRVFIRFSVAKGYEVLPKGNFRVRCRDSGIVHSKIFNDERSARIFYLETKHDIICRHIDENIAYIDDRIVKKFRRSEKCIKQ